MKLEILQSQTSLPGSGPGRIVRSLLNKLSTIFTKESLTFRSPFTLEKDYAEYERLLICDNALPAEEFTLHLASITESTGNALHISVGDALASMYRSGLYPACAGYKHARLLTANQNRLPRAWRGLTLVFPGSLIKHPMGIMVPFVAYGREWYYNWQDMNCLFRCRDFGMTRRDYVVLCQTHLSDQQFPQLFSSPTCELSSSSRAEFEDYLTHNPQAFECKNESRERLSK